MTEPDNHGKIYEAILLPRRNTWIVVVLVVLIVAGVTMGLAVGLTRNNNSSSSAPPTPDTASSSLAWIGNSQVEQVARQLPNATIATILADMPNNSQRNSSSSTTKMIPWYMDPVWRSTSYQPIAGPAQAWQWLVSDDSIIVDYTSASDIVARFAMASIYFDMGGPAWSQRQGWLDTSKSVCEWYSSASAAADNSNYDYGSKCRQDGLTQLALDNNGLIGMLPFEMSLLTTLTSLQFTNQRALEGSLPESLAALTRLQHLDLSSTGIQGALPASLGQLTQLTQLELQEALIRGPFPTSMARLTRLQHVDVQFAYPSLQAQEFPNAALLSQWTNLSYLRLTSTSNQNALFGTLPTDIGLATSLTSLSLENFKLTGSLPDEMGNLSKLQSLRLSGTEAGGALPGSMAQLTSLRVLDLEFNILQGSITSKMLQGWQNLTSFNVGNNRFSGTLSSQIVMLTLAELVDFGNNKMTGSLPSEIGRLSSVRELILGGNL